MTVVPAAGRSPNPVLLVGEAPGREEASKGQPFVGKAGAEQEWYLSRRGLSAKFWRRTNVVPEYTPGNPDPSPAQIRRWSPVLEAEVAECAPSLIVAVGRFAARWFLGEEADLEVVHGIPHWAGTFDSRRAHRGGPANKGRGALILPVYHPALGFYNNDARALIDWDYSRVAEVLSRIEKGKPVEVPHDDYPECYLDVGGGELAEILAADPPSEIGVDTEGTSKDIRVSVPWSIQVATAPGLAYVLRCSRSDFSEGIASLRRLIYDDGCETIVHNRMYDGPMCARMGLNLSSPDILVHDTMYDLYVMRLESRALKASAWRWCGMRMDNYEDVVGDIGIDKQTEWLSKVLAGDWPKPESRVVLENDGTTRLYTPGPVDRAAESILVDYFSDKRDKDGNLPDPVKRWAKVVERIPEITQVVEEELGPLPIATLADVPLQRAVDYAGRDADAALRLKHALRPELSRQGLLSLSSHGDRILPIFEEIQSTGLPASRRYFEKLEERMTEEMLTIGSRLSYRYNSKNPFNPNSGPQVQSLMKRRGLKGRKLTKETREVSTAKGSIEYLRHTDPAISDVFEWRERGHIRDSFCKPVLGRIPSDKDIYTIRCLLKATRTATRRLSAEDPNLLNIPIRTELGRLVRDGYECPEGTILLAADLSQIEARYLASDSGDPFMCQLFREGRDIHRETASRTFGIELKDVDKTQRDSAKTTNYGLIYGQSPKGLQDELWKLGLTEWQEKGSLEEMGCEGLIASVLGVYPGVAEYMAETERILYEDEVIYDYWGMPRHLPGIRSRKQSVRAEAARIAVSHRVQGGAQGMIQNSMLWLWPRIVKMREKGAWIWFCLQVHDEIILWLEDDQGLVEEAKERVIESLTKHSGIELRVPVEAEAKVARRWGDLKG